MRSRKGYLAASAGGLIVMAAGQYIARPEYYGTGLGRAWAHVFWLGFVLFCAPLVTLFICYVANHKNMMVVAAGKRQLVGITVLTSLAGLLALIAQVGYGNAGGRGVFVLWLLMLTIFTIVNLGALLFAQSKRA